MTRAVIYARYSSDLQTDASIEDQIRVAKDRAKRENWEIVEHYADHGISGASLIRRPSLQKLMQDASEGKFNVVVAEALDRLSRDQEDVAGIYKRLAFAGVKIITLSEGEVNEMHIGLKGTMNALFLKDLADKIRRGQRGVIENGKSGGGLCFGYDIVKKLDGNGELIRGDRSINSKEAEIITYIFKEFSIGKSPKAIAKQLNKDGIAGPNGGTWGPSTIHGNRQRGTGILNNELYIGQLVWNRLQYIKNPDTGKRVSRLNPETVWVRKDVPHLRIISQDLWDKVKSKQGAIKLQHKEFWGKQRPKALFTGLMKCGCCGSGYTKVKPDAYGCFAAHQKGMCDNKLMMKQADMEGLVLGALQKHLMNPELCQIFCDEYTRHMNDLRIQQSGQRAANETELKRRMREEDRLVQMILDGVASTHSLKDKINANSARIQELKDILVDKPEVPPLLPSEYGSSLPQRD
jgi:site-specific DNA recombinase